MFETTSQYKTHKVQLSNGCIVAYIDEGRGDTTLLFVHGLATYGKTWALNIDGLCDKYRCVAIDLPGNGHSDGGDYPYGINFYSGCVYDFMQQLKLDNVILVGHSMGGQIVLNLVINHPGACKELILCAPAGFETYSRIERTMFSAGMHFLDFFSTEENSLRQIIRSSFFNYPSKMEDMVKELVELMKVQPVAQYRKMIEACIMSMMEEPVFDGLKTIQQRTLVLFGEHDALIPNNKLQLMSTRGLAERGVAQMPNATLHMLPRCGHFLQLEKPAKTNELIKEFLSATF